MFDCAVVGRLRLLTREDIEGVAVAGVPILMLA